MTINFTSGGSRTKATTDTWLTPPELVQSLGEFHLDPCAPPDAPFYHAPIYYTEAIDGLKMPWFGRVFCNPPYGRKASAFLERCADHGNAIAIIFARTETVMFREMVWRRADAVMFIHGRISFYDINGVASDRANAPSVLVAYGQNNVDALRGFAKPGTILDVRNGATTL
jgi:hypothetical protein